MKKTIGLCALLLTTTILSAQTDDREDDKNRAEIEKQKIAYLSTELALTEDESKAFWPVYNAYQEELKKFRELLTESKKETQGRETQLTEAEMDRHMAMKFDMERQRIAVDEQYYQRFKGVLPVQKVADLYKAERGFKKELMQKMRERRGAVDGDKKQEREQYREHDQNRESEPNQERR